MAGFRYRLVGTSGSEIGIITFPDANVQVGETIWLPGAAAPPRSSITATTRMGKRAA